MTEYSGSCHCGAIVFSYETALSPPNWSIRACQCSFCRAHNALSTSDPSGELHFATNDARLLQRYRFGLKTADFLLCRNCGVYIGAVIQTDNGMWGIINTHALDNEPNDIAGVSPIRYDKENTSGRVSRREERWTPATLNGSDS